MTAQNPIKNSLSHLDNPGSRWDTGEYRVERICTCSSKSAECGPGRYHCVDSYMSCAVAFQECAKLNLQTDLPRKPSPYIIVARSDGKRLWGIKPNALVDDESKRPAADMDGGVAIYCKSASGTPTVSLCPVY